MDCWATQVFSLLHRDDIACLFVFAVVCSPRKAHFVGLGLRAAANEEHLTFWSFSIKWKRSRINQQVSTEIQRSWLSEINTVPLQILHSERWSARWRPSDLTENFREGEHWSAYFIQENSQPRLPFTFQSRRRDQFGIRFADWFLWHARRVAHLFKPLLSLD